MSEEAPVEFTALQPEPFPEIRDVYAPFAPPVPYGGAEEAQVLAGSFVRRWFLSWRSDAAAWWQLHPGEATGCAEIAMRLGWIGRSEGEVRAYCFGFVAGRECGKSPTARVRLVDSVLREAKLLPWPEGEAMRNDLAGWIRTALRPTEFGFGGIPTAELVELFERDHPGLIICRRNLEMRLAGAVREAWGHERGVRPSNGIIDRRTRRRTRGWMGLEAQR